jgi:hypothetical protein
LTGYLDEIRSNFEGFTAEWRQDLAAVTTELDRSNSDFLRSYRRMVSLNGWRELILRKSVSADSLGFYLEAQNDALVSHVFARMGSWRSSLKALRSSIENVMFSLYYKDHPVELSLWGEGRHIMNFSELISYFEKHPLVRKTAKELPILELLKNEYRVLSKSVHGSAATFRMSGPRTQLWSGSQASLRSWGTRESHTVAGINLLLIVLFQSDLQGASHLGLRQALALAVPSKYHRQIKESLRITLPKIQSVP